MTNRLLKFWSLAAFVCLLLVVCFVPLVHAAEPHNGLQLSPLRSRPTLNPGDTATGQLTIANHTDNSLPVSLSVEQFKTTNEDYDYSFGPAEHADWIRLADSSVTLEKNTSKNIAYSMAIPANAQPGGYYFALLASSSSQPSTTSINEIKRVASLIYLEVSGDLHRKASLLGVDTPWLAIHPGVQLESRLTNQGDTHFDARLQYTITSTLNHAHKPVQTQALLLPGTVRKLQTKATLPFWPGLYTVHVVLGTPEGIVQSITVRIVYAPWWSWLVVIAVIVAISQRLCQHKKHRLHKRINH